MTYRRRETLRGVLAILLSLTGLVYASVPSVKAISWNTSQEVLPENSCYYLGHPIYCIDTWPSTSQDQLGRIWLVWAEQPQGIPGSRADIYYRLWAGGPLWGSKVQVTSDTNQDVNPYVTSLANGSLIILWSSNRTGTYQLFYKTYLATGGTPSPATGDVRLTNSATNDTQPSAVKDRNGRIWVFWNRNGDIYYKYYNGTLWSLDFALPPASSSLDGERTPTVIQRKDGRVMVAWASITSSGSGDPHPYYTSTDATIPTLPPSGIPAGAWASVEQFFTDKSRPDDKPSLAQARDGTLLVFWQRGFTNDFDIYWASSIDNAASWTNNPAPFANTGNEEIDVAATPMSDGRIWVFWNVLTTGMGTAPFQIWTTTSNQITNIHDIGIVSLTASSYFIRSGDSVNIDVTVKNYGDYNQNSTLTVRLTTMTTSTIIQTLPLSLVSGEKRLVQFAWNSSQSYWGFWGRYNLTATLQSVPLENTVNQGDNYVSAGLMRISPLGDLDRNGKVDIVDAARLAFAYGSTGPPLTPPTLLWDPEADLDHNGIVNISDAAQLAFYYGNSV